MSEPYGVLLITGLYTHQEIYAGLFAADRRCRLVAVADEADVSAQRHQRNVGLAERWGLPYIPDLDRALARSDVQIASVCAEHERRGRVAVRCAEAGKHLYLDKPIACSIQDADAIVAAVERTGVLSQMFSFNGAPWALEARRILQSGEIGEIRFIHCDILFAKGHAGTAKLGRPRQEAAVPKRFTFVDSKHELRATGVYSVALIQGLLGCRATQVYAVTGNYFFEEHQRNDVEDFGMLLITMENGTTASISAGRIGWNSHRSGGPCEIHLIGTKGRVEVDARRPRIEIAAEMPPWHKPTRHPEDPMGFWPGTQRESGSRAKPGWIPLKTDAPGDVARFLDRIDQGRESEVSAANAAHGVEILMAGYLSAACCEPVFLPLAR